MSWSVRVVPLLVTIAFTNVARGDEPEAVPIDSLPSASSSAPRRGSSSSSWSPSRHDFAHGWYGWQTLLVDGAALAMVGASAATSDDDSPKGPLLALGAGTYFLGAPVVHFAHRHMVKGLVSLAIRAVPWGLYALAASASSEHCSSVVVGPASSCSDGFVVTTAAIAIISVPAAITIDAAVLARDDAPRTEAKATFEPTFVLRRDRAVVGVGGTF